MKPASNSSGITHHAPRTTHHALRITHQSPLIVIVGPTAVGKTSMAIRLAENLPSAALRPLARARDRRGSGDALSLSKGGGSGHCNGEIVSADSRQIYRGMDVGTAKPTAEELARVPHHLIDIVDPDEDYHVAQFQKAAYAAIDDIHARGKVPFLVGGTGQYVHAVVEGWQIPPVPPRPDFRQQLRAEAEEHGSEHLHSRLAEVDPEAAERIHPNNVRRVIRALEVHEATGRPISDWQEKQPPPYRVLQIGLTMDREALYQRIDARVDRMIAGGLVDEVRNLLAEGYTFDLPAMSGLGYGEFEAYVRGEATLDEVVQEIKHETHRFVRHQYNWFSEDDPGIHWFDVEQDTYRDIAALVADFLWPAQPDPE